MAASSQHEMQALLHYTRELGLLILQHLKQIRVQWPKEDVSEYLTTAQMVQVVMNKIGSNEDLRRYAPKIQVVHKTTQEYESLLKKLVLDKSLRQHKKIEQFNSQLHKALNEILKDMDIREPNNNPFLSPSSQSRKDVEAEQDEEEEMEVLSFEEELEHEADQKVANEKRTKFLVKTMRNVITDAGGKKWWTDSFGGQFMVEWEDWEKAILSKGKQNEAAHAVLSDPSYRLRLCNILDNHGTGMVSMYKFGEFLHGFGPFEFCMENTLEILRSPWFYGFLSAPEVEFLLGKEPVGTYLVRFSKSNPGSFSLAFVVKNPSKPVLHILINNEPDNRFSVQEPKGKAHFETLGEVIGHYSKLLLQPYQTQIPLLDGYHFGELSGEEAEEYLADACNGSYLLRFQREPAAFILSYRFDDMAYHSTLDASSDHIGFQGDTDVFPTVAQLIEAYGDVLLFPMDASSFLPEEAEPPAPSPSPSPAAGARGGKSGGASPTTGRPAGGSPAARGGSPAAGASRAAAAGKAPARGR